MMSTIRDLFQAFQRVADRLLEATGATNRLTNVVERQTGIFDRTRQGLEEARAENDDRWREVSDELKKVNTQLAVLTKGQDGVDKELREVDKTVREASLSMQLPVINSRPPPGSGVVAYPMYYFTKLPMAVQIAVLISLVASGWLRHWFGAK